MRGQLSAFLSHAVLGLAVGLVMAFLALAGVVDMLVAKTVLWIAWIIAVLGVGLNDWLHTRRTRNKILFFLAFAGFTAVGAWGLQGWTERKVGEAKNNEAESRAKEIKKMAEELAEKFPPVPSILVGASKVDFGQIVDGGCSDTQNVFVSGAKPGDAATVSFIRLPKGLQQGPVSIPSADTVSVSVCNLSGGPVTLKPVPVKVEVVRGR
jgi:hypothetical protein